MLKKNLLSLALSLGVATSSYAFFEVEDVSENKSNYLGVDFSVNSMCGDGGWKDLTASVHPGFSFYFGHKPVNRSFGIEVGHTWSFNKETPSLLTQESSILGLKNDSGKNVEIKTKVKLRTGYFDCVFYTPPKEIQMFLSGGMAICSHKLTITKNTEHESLANLGNIAIKHKFVPRLGAGLLLHINQDYMVKMGVYWTNSSKIKAYGKNDFTLAEEHRKIFKNSYDFRFGLTFKI